MTIKLRKRTRPDAIAFAKRTMKKFPNVMAHLAETEQQDKISTPGQGSMTNADADPTRPNFAEIATRVTEKYPTVLAHLAEIERLETGERKDATDGDETSEGPKS